MADEGNVVFSRKLLKKFIKLYKELPCLWDRNCLTYKRKQSRHEAVTKLTEMVQQYDSTATRVHILRKIESLRACLRREHKKVVASRKIAREEKEIYVPHLWYYNLMTFVLPDSGKQVGLTEGESMNQDSGEEDFPDEPSPDDDDYPDYSVHGIVEVRDRSPIASRFLEEDGKEKRHCTEVEDEYDAIGVNVAAKLRGLPSNMRILAEKLINDVLYQAQMNGLDSSSAITTNDPFKQDDLK